MGRVVGGANPAVTLFDEDGNPVIVITDGMRAIAVRDEEALDELKTIGRELRKIRLLLEMGQDTQVGDDIDFEDGPR